MNKEKIVYEKMLEYNLPIFKFGSNHCIFFSGFKFERDVSEDVDVYRCYSTRKTIYSKLTEAEMDYILEHGVFKASARDSYKSYDVLFRRYSSVLTNKKSSKKMIDKANNILGEYSKRREKIIDRYPSLEKELLT
jgi:hypothetical protein